MDLFETQVSNVDMPLAEVLRPTSISQVLGLERVYKKNPWLKKLIEQKQKLPNLILWGPPGTGKTTFAKLLCQQFEFEYLELNAIDTGAKKLKEVGLQSRNTKLMYQKQTLVFIDETHRLNKAQQDVLLPFTERGDLILVGATTEHPSYEINKALLSRSRVIVFESHTVENLVELIGKATAHYNYKPEDILSEAAQEAMAMVSSGDARLLLNNFENIVTLYELSREAYTWPLSFEDFNQIIQVPPSAYDKNGEHHYDAISAFIKSVRGSDPDAAIYYLAKMINAGEDPVFIARRLIILASEDIGNADPRAITLATSCLEAVKAIGLPEAGISLAQAVVYMSCAPKSNSSYRAYKEALKFVSEGGDYDVPMDLRSSKTKLSKEIGYGKNYKYSHDSGKGFVKQNFLPKEIKDKKFYEAVSHGFEKKMIEYLEWLRS